MWTSDLLRHQDSGPLAGLRSRRVADVFRSLRRSCTTSSMPRVSFSRSTLCVYGFGDIRRFWYTMCLVTTLRLAFKQALNSGRVYKQRLNVCDPSPTPAGDVRVDFEQYARLLSDCEWTAFQRDERAYRGTLDTQLLQVRSNFAVTHGGAEKWGRLVTILTSAFFINGIFSATQRNSRPYGFQLLKYVARILKKFPLSADFPVDLTPDSLTPWIEMQLRFIRERIQPALRAAGTETQRQQRKVSRNKLAYLWQHRKSKAIDIILNNSCFPETPPTVSDTANVYNHYKAKWLEVKQAKCAVLHERRSGGNRWYKAKNDKPPSFLVMGQPIKVYSRNETYPYLGHRFNIAGEWGSRSRSSLQSFSIVST
ncbi:hypothetical protein F7725_013634 [Dissostichus mawsoni]|uniref:Uncharacterized protein n=1 Tax=Dissostichus mawsoni TaxID=36200 RepID=A0A7J5YTX7_DISMA|nr:hypothetical protein F7725_013634 [Dissostichus mawsoni]